MIMEEETGAMHCEDKEGATNHEIQAATRS